MGNPNDSDNNGYNETAEAGDMNPREERRVWGNHVVKTIAKYALIGAAIVGALFAGAALYLVASGGSAAIQATPWFVKLPVIGTWLGARGSAGMAGDVISLAGGPAMSWGMNGIVAGLALGAVAGLVQGVGTAKDEVQRTKEDQLELVTRAQDREQRLFAFRAKETEQKALRDQFEREHGLSPALGGGRGQVQGIGIV